MLPEVINDFVKRNRTKHVYLLDQDTISGGFEGQCCGSTKGDGYFYAAVRISGKIAGKVLSCIPNLALPWLLPLSQDLDRMRASRIMVARRDPR